MPERIVYRAHIPHNTGLAWEMARSQHLRLYGQSIGDFVCFNRHHLRERFDQARTKTYCSKIWISTGDLLISKFNNPMLRIVYDGFAGTGTHDLQKGMCSGPRFQRAAQEGRLAEYYNRDIRPEELPDHGCWENLSRALAPWGIPPEDIPSPFNVFQHLHIDCTTGAMRNTTVRPRPGTYIEFRAEMDLLCALSACPDLTVGGKPYDVVVCELA
ncbi:MAG TPA: urea carboxylase-associated family protein [Chloroflexota bacterium]|nr:urea carboxylase-associated family protein [Chloroflexota bacterium]